MTPEQPTLIVPDVHLKISTLRRVLSDWGKRGPVVFLGDFFDDFGDSPALNRQMAECLREEILPVSEYTVLMGNHDLHYHPMCPPSLRCSGFSQDKLDAIGQVLELRDFSKFKWSHSLGCVLFTHAGLHPRFIPPFAEAAPSLLSSFVNERCAQALAAMNPTEPLLRAGYSRYGDQPSGGVIWMDVEEYQHINGLSQIFGHTPVRNPYLLGDGKSPSLCLDTHLRHVGFWKSPGDVFGVECAGVGDGLSEWLDSRTRRRPLETAKKPLRVKKGAVRAKGGDIQP